MINFFSPLVGQEQAIELLTEPVIQNRVAPAYLFAGPDGVGRSLAARCFVEQMFCTPLGGQASCSPAVAALQNRLRQGNHPDLLWVQPTYLHQGQRLSVDEAAAVGLKRKAPPAIRLEQIREVALFLSRPPLEAPRNVVVLEQAETMAEAAANALLKTLEEPGQATLILIAPAAESLLPTLVSRCQRIPFHHLDRDGMAQVLRQKDYGEILNQEPVLAIAAGSPGKALASWQQLQAVPSDLLQTLTQLPQSLRSALELARQIDKTLDTEAQLWLVDYLQHCYWQKFLAGEIQELPLPHLEQARKFLLSYAQPRLVWEVTLLKLQQAVSEKQVSR